MAPQGCNADAARGVGGIGMKVTDSIGRGEPMMGGGASRERKKKNTAWKREEGREKRYIKKLLPERRK
jgi:hypothetical protein